MNIANNNKFSVDNEQHDFKNKINGKASFRYAGIWPLKAKDKHCWTSSSFFQVLLLKLA